MKNKIVNICLHDIVQETNDIKSIYDVTINQLTELITVLKNALYVGDITHYELFFDDGHRSFWDYRNDIDFGVSNDKVHTAVITELIDTPGKMLRDDIAHLAKEGYSVDSHGVSHAALAIFQNNSLIPSTKGGAYQNMPYGKNAVLSTEEIRFQLLESSKTLKEITGKKPRLFVFPFGLYNQNVLNILSSEAVYERAFTCDSAFDTHQFLAPRLLITQENISNFANLLKELPEQPQLLTSL